VIATKIVELLQQGPAQLMKIVDYVNPDRSRFKDVRSNLNIMFLQGMLKRRKIGSGGMDYEYALTTWLEANGMMNEFWT
jgi:predicted transcriptional regulator